jgi:hypothetical protein
MYSRHRAAPFRVTTRFTERGDRVYVSKLPETGEAQVSAGPLVLRTDESVWVDSPSLQTQLLARCQQRGLSLEKLFEPCVPWVAMLRSLATPGRGPALVPGRYVDAIWKNAYLDDGKCVLIDQEWEWRGPLTLNVLVIRAAYEFLAEVARFGDPNLRLVWGSRTRRIAAIAQSLGVRLTRGDFNQFRTLQAEITALAFGESSRRTRRHVWLCLHSPSVDMKWRIAPLVSRAASRVATRIARLGRPR